MAQGPMTPEGGDREIAHEYARTPRTDVVNRRRSLKGRRFAKRLSAAANVRPAVAGVLLVIAAAAPLLGCSTESRASFFARSPKEMLSTVLRLYYIDPGTKLNEYERILGARFELTQDYKTGLIPFESYTLEGSTKVYGIGLEISGMSRGPNPPKKVDIRMFGLDRLTCISKSDIDSLASRGFQILNPLPIPAPQIGYSVVRPDNPHDRIMNVGYSEQTPERCVNYVLIDFQLVPDGWGH